MRRWFLSYHSPDQALAERLKAAIERQDLGARVFFAPINLRAGGFWSAQLAQEIADATAFALLVGERGLGQWQVFEYDEALDKRVKSPDFPVVLMLLEGQAAPGLPFLRRLHWIVTPDPASEKDVARLIDAAVSGRHTRPGELWRYTLPYRGLVAMEEKDSDYFFGRDRETVEVLNALALAPDRLPVLLGNSGVGKSSLAQAGVLAALKRQAWPEGAGATGVWPHAFQDSRRWCFLTLKPGAEPLKALVEPFLDTWQLGATDPERVKQQNGWIELLRDGKGTLRDLLDATERHYKELDRPKPPAFFLYVDQGEELYVRSEERERRRFSELIAQTLVDPRFGALISLRADFLGALQNDEPLYAVHRKIDVPPLREAELREVVSRPAALLSARFETDALAADIARRAAEESAKDAGALPLLSYLLDDMWSSMIARGDGVLRLPAAAIEFGGVLAERANAYLARNPHSEDALRRVLTLKLATVREDGEPTRRRALRSEFCDEEWRLVSELADHPNRLLVTATSEAGETYAEVAHEAIFRRWEKLREWIGQERDFLAWRSEIEAARRRWQGTSERSRKDALLMGLSLAQAQSWLAVRAEDLPKTDREFIEQSLKRESEDQAYLNLLRHRRDLMQRRTRQMAGLAAVLALGIGAGLAWSSRDYLQARAVTLAEAVWPKVLSAEAERALPPKQIFTECAHCPEMVVMPAGEFWMGSPEDEKDRYNNEGSRHKVTIARAFAVSRFEVTSDEWDACVILGGCKWPAPEADWGRGRRPVMNVSWDDAQKYVAWLSERTGKRYRLLSEAEWEYAARAGSDKAYSWGDEIGKNNANCNGCDSQWDFKQTAPVGSFAPNAFGLYDMHGNVWEWIQDCYNDSYNGAPTDGSAWTAGDCTRRVVRGGSWFDSPRYLRSANRNRDTSVDRGSYLGFRVGRTLDR
jgi:formylglycine-generating enzyme required for sulfatase activity